MEKTDTRPPFAASGGIIPLEFRKIKTPCYVLDETALIKNAELMGKIAERTGCKMLLAQKAFSNYDCYHLLEPYLAGTEASGLYEARLGAQEMPGKEVHVFCAGYREDEFEELLCFADHIVFNSPSQLLRFGKRAKQAGKSVGLRINPECSTQEGHAIYDPCAPGSRMGTTRAQWEAAVKMHPDLTGLLDGIHFHTLCEQDSSDLETTLAAVKVKFGDLISKVKWLNLGGGHHITRPGYDIARLEKCIEAAKEEWKVDIYLEPGEAWALNAGFFLTTDYQKLLFYIHYIRTFAHIPPVHRSIQQISPVIPFFQVIRLKYCHIAFQFFCLCSYNHPPSVIFLPYFRITKMCCVSIWQINQGALFPERLPIVRYSNTLICFSPSFSISYITCIEQKVCIFCCNTRS